MVTQKMPSRANRLPSYMGRTGTVLDGTASNPNHHRLRDRPQAGRPDVEVQAILTGDGMFRHKHIPRRKIRQLGRLLAEYERVADAAPCLDWLRRPEPSVAKGWRSVRDALEGMHTVTKSAAHLSATGPDDSVHLHDSSTVRNVKKESRRRL